MDVPQYQIFISIHALLAESDPRNWRKPHGQKTFLSTLSLRRATKSDTATGFPLSFLSTLSLRRATNTSIAGRITSNDFYPRSPCGERQLRHATYKYGTLISIHALLAESDRARRPSAKHTPKFLSTLSLRRATLCCGAWRALTANFYPRSPCGERL